MIEIYIIMLTIGVSSPGAMLGVSVAAAILGK